MRKHSISSRFEISETTPTTYRRYDANVTAVVRNRAVSGSRGLESPSLTGTPSCGRRVYVSVSIVLERRECHDTFRLRRVYYLARQICRASIICPGRHFTYEVTRFAVRYRQGRLSDDCTLRFRKTAWSQLGMWKRHSLSRPKLPIQSETPHSAQAAGAFKTVTTRADDFRSHPSFGKYTFSVIHAKATREGHLKSCSQRGDFAMWCTIIRL